MADTTVVIRHVGSDVVALAGSWIVDGDGVCIGLHLHHPYDEITEGRWPKCGGGGYVAWSTGARGMLVARHTLVAGGPGEPVDALTLSPSLWHRARDQADETCPASGDGSRNSPHRECHGFVEAGRWRVA